MTPSKRRRYEKQLKGAREQSMLVVAATTAVTGRRRDMRNATGSYGECALIEQEIDNIIAEQESDTLAAIDRALHVLQDEPEVFGRCEECGNEIPEAWLDIAPWLSRCEEHVTGAIAF